MYHDKIALTMQDILKLDQEARMNLPGVKEGNWSWQLSQLPNFDICSFYRELASMYAR